MNPLLFPSKVFLAPMAGITDVAFRALCATYGAGLTVTELISAQGLVRNNDKSKELYKRAEQEKPFAIQLFGSDPKIMAKAALLVEPYCDMIDINMGCPAPNVCKIGAGSALLATPRLGGEIVRAVADAVSIPVTAKMRIGLTHSHENLALTLAKACEENGASLLTIHGRTQAQQYSGVANWEAIRDVKNIVNIPVVGNGDISSPEVAKNRLKITDFVSVGRACSGNPLLFQEIITYLNKGVYTPSTNESRLASFNEYLSLAKEFQTPFTVQRLQAQHFTKGIQGASRVRLALNSAQNPEALAQAVSSLFQSKE